MDIKRINFTGAQGTGKTSVLKALQQDPEFAEFEFVTEVVRNFVKEKGITINKQGTPETQEVLFEAYENVLSKQNSYVSDRCIIDVCAYTASGRNAAMSNIDKWIELEQKQEKEIIQRKSELGLVCYFPIEFEIVADGARSIDKEYQKEIDGKIHQILHSNLISHLIMHGSVEERVKAIKAILFKPVK